jgi:hypothetical protein
MRQSRIGRFMFCLMALMGVGRAPLPLVVEDGRFGGDADGGLPARLRCKLCQVLGGPPVIGLRVVFRLVVGDVACERKNRVGVCDSLGLVGGVRLEKFMAFQWDGQICGIFRVNLIAFCKHSSRPECR